jgi:glucan phosphoethanolaminetransferase (alkaline phosphatase superfamily)
MILDISSWWQAMDGFSKFFWFIAILFSILFILQMFMTFLGGGDTAAVGDADTFIDGDAGIGSQFFTIKNLIFFFTLFGWTGVVGIQNDWNRTITVVAAVMAGVAMVVMMLFLIRSLMKMESSGTMKIQNALNTIGKAYLPIPANRKGTGKVQLKVQGSIHELIAITDDNADIATGSVVKVKGIIGDELLLVTTNTD